MAYDDQPSSSPSNLTVTPSSPSTSGPSEYTQQWTDLTVKFNLVSSLLSFFSSGIVLGIMVFSQKARSTGNLARTVLLMCLFFFDFINAGLLSATGIMRLVNKLYPGTFCTIHGYFAQYTVQGTDLTTFALAVITFVVGSASHNIENLSRCLKQVERAVIPMTVAIFVIPCISATIGYFLIGYGVTGSWCWLNVGPKPLATYARYGLTHGPRIFIIVSIIAMYTYMYYSFRVRIREQENMLKSTFGSAQMSSISNTMTEKRSRSSVWGDDNENLGTSAMSGDERAQQQIRMKSDAQRAAIMKLLVYPTAFTILWIPGLVNRFAEASNQSADFLLITNFFQFTTQLVGFANSVIFGYARFFSKSSGGI
ncbi:hypothetical protein HDU97_007309 [Phlyctochytrium planicorne]|nr:hypothetical protein HDU97_007309 [Phlyctochytrium planicorne]